MSPHSLWSAALLSTLAAQASVVGCSSSSSAGAGSTDGGYDAAGGGGAEGGVTEAASGTEAGSVTDAGGGGDEPVTCEASVLPPPDAGGACNECLKTGCPTELAACAADCICGPIVACLQLSNINNYQPCNGLPAIESNEAALMTFAACAANPAKCGGACFGNDGG